LFAKIIKYQRGNSKPLTIKGKKLSAKQKNSWYEDGKYKRTSSTLRGKWRPGKNTTSSILVSEYETVHGRILAVNMAHIRKKRQTAEQEGQNDNVFHKINEANSGE